MVGPQLPKLMTYLSKQKYRVSPYHDGKQAGQDAERNQNTDTNLRLNAEA